MNIPSPRFPYDICLYVFQLGCPNWSTFPVAGVERPMSTCSKIVRNWAMLRKKYVLPKFWDNLDSRKAQIKNHFFFCIFLHFICNATWISNRNRGLRGSFSTKNQNLPTSAVSYIARFLYFFLFVVVVPCICCTKLGHFEWHHTQAATGSPFCFLIWEGGSTSPIDIAPLVCTHVQFKQTWLTFELLWNECFTPAPSLVVTSST